MTFRNEIDGMFMIHLPADVHVLGPEGTSGIGIKRKNE
jgi:hypothetical protein